VSPRRTVILVAAVLVAALAAFTTYAWLNGVQDRAYKDATLVRVYKVSKDIEKGATGEQALQSESIRADKAPKEFRPATALTDINVIRGKVALTKLSAGQIVVDGMFVEPRIAQVTAAQRVPAGQVAVTISVDQVQGVAGLLVPGDKVDIMVSKPDSTQMLFQNVDILFIGQTAAPQAGDTQAVQSTASNLITFAVPPIAAQKIILATKTEGASVHLALVPPDNQPVPVPLTNNGSLFQGGLTPYGG
jgi:pilus assembly protein CpaB